MKRFLLFFMPAATIASTALAQPDAASADELLKKIEKTMAGSSLSAQLFMGFQYVQTGGLHANEFLIKRGYLSYRKAITEHLSGRITPDITIDHEGDGLGDVEMRLKYCYMEYKRRGGAFFTEPSILFGEVFTPWIEFEEKINLYRVQSPHYLDRIKTLSSADFGVTVTSLLGGKVDETYQKNVNSGYPGKFGSLSFGLYNGGGYHAIEVNNNKTLQWRLSLRPLPNALTGLQFSYAGVTGKGNTELSPEWRMHTGFVSYESRRIILTGQYFSGVGNHEGSLADVAGVAYANRGYSLFADARLLHRKLSLIGRRDVHEIDKAVTVTMERSIAGLVCHIGGKNKMLLAVDHTEYLGMQKPKQTIYELTVELAF